MKYSIGDIRATLSDEKNKSDSLWVQYIARKCSYPITLLALRLGMSAWAVSLFSVLVAFSGCFLLALNSVILRGLGIILIELWMILDCVDGNVARFNKTTGPMGEFMDAESGYVISAFLYFSIGVASFFTASFENVPKETWLVLGAIASISNILPRLIHQKYLVSQLKLAGRGTDTHSESVKKESAFQVIRKRVGKDFGLSGICMPWLIISFFSNSFVYMVLFYAIFSVGALIVTIVMYSYKARK